MDEYVSKFGMQMTQRTWANFRWDFFGAIAFSVFNVVFNQFYVPMAIRHGASNLEVGLLSAAPAIGLVISPLWASLMQGRDPKPFAVYPNVLGRTLVIVAAFFPLPWVFVAIAMVYNLLMGIQAPAYAALVSRIYPADQRGRLMGNVRVAMGFFMIPLAYLAGHWIDLQGYALPLVVGSVTGVLSILLFARVQEIPSVSIAKRDGPIKAKEQWSFVKRNPALALFFVATTLSGFGNLVANPIYQIIQVHQLNLSNVDIGYARVVYFICLLIAYFVMGWMIDRYSPKHAMFVGIAVYCLAPLLYAAFDNYSAVLIASGLQGIGDATWDIGCMAYIFRIAPGQEGIVFGLHLMLFGIRGTIGPLLSTGLSHTVSMQAILYGAALCGLVGLLVLFVSGRFSNQKPSLDVQRNFT